MLTVKGVVLNQRTVGEQDRFIDVLTADYGVLEIMVRGAGKLTSKTGSATQLFAYSEFCLADKKGRSGGARMLNSVTPIRIFYELRQSVTAVALASYCSQVLQFAVLPRAGVPELLRLMLNCLHFLTQKGTDERQLKAVFELRTAALLGFLPDVIMCRTCGTYLPEELVFYIEDGYFVCKDCAEETDVPRPAVEMTAGTLQAIRHIVLSDFEKIFSFRIAAHCREPLYRFAEEFLQYHIDRRMPALEYYHAVAPPSSI